MVEYSLVKHKHSLLCSSHVHVLWKLPCCLLFGEGRGGGGGGGGAENPLITVRGGGEVSVKFCVGINISVSVT